MICNIGLLSEFKEERPDANLDWEYITGVASVPEEMLWVFVDRIAFLRNSEENIMTLILRTTIHELIHLCGFGEVAAYFGVDLVMYNETN